MIKKYESFLFFIIAALLFFLSAGFSYALEIKPEYYPPIPFAPVITEKSQLPVFVAYFFALGIYLAGILAVISLAIGGIQLIASTGNPETVGDAKGRIKGAVLGLVLTLASVIILSTINPVLITPTLTSLPTGAGVFYSNGVRNEEKTAPYSESDTSTIPAGYNKIIYKCSAEGPGTGPVLLIQKFPQKNFDGHRGAITERVNCGGETAINKLSFKMSFETPGVYYFTGAGCTGFRSQANLSNTQEIEEPFKSEARSVLIINDIRNNINYGVVLHKEINFRGDCGWPLDSYQQERRCYNFSSPASANIFTLNNNSPEAAKTSGNGVVFYSKPFGYKTGTNAGYLELSPETISTFWRGSPSIIDFRSSYRFVNVPEWEKTLCTYFAENIKHCGGSIKVQGNYLAVLYARQLQSQNLYCQVFDKDVPNLKEEEVTAVQGRKLETIYVIPTK